MSLIPVPPAASAAFALPAFDPAVDNQLDKSIIAAWNTDPRAEARDLRRALDECGKRCADLCIERNANRATIQQLQDALEESRQALTAANQQIECLEGQLAAVISVIESEVDDQALPWEGGE